MVESAGLATEVAVITVPAVELETVDLWYDSYRALTNVSFSIARGEFVAVVGPTGSGKSSILNLVAGLLKLTRGEIRTEGDPVLSLNSRCGYMFQADALLPWRTAIDNVLLGPTLRGVPRREAHEEALAWLDRVGLRGFENRYPRHLSGGQRKRVAMAQVLINQPEILLMDEPFGALDAQTRTLMGQELSDLAAELGSTVLFVTHDLEEAIALSDRVILITSGPEAHLKGEYPVPLARPRQVTDARFMDGFEAIYERVWRDLKEEVMVAYEHNH